MNTISETIIQDIEKQLLEKEEVVYQLTDKIFYSDFNYTREYSRYKLNKSQRLGKYLYNIIEKILSNVIKRISINHIIVDTVGGSAGLEELGMYIPKQHIPGEIWCSVFPTHQVPQFSEILDKNAEYIRKKDPNILSRLYDEEYREKWLKIPEQFSLPGSETFFPIYSLPCRILGKNFVFEGENHLLPVVYYQLKIKRGTSSLPEEIFSEINPHYSEPVEEWGLWKYNSGYTE